MYSIYAFVFKEKLLCYNDTRVNETRNGESLGKTEEASSGYNAWLRFKIFLDPMYPYFNNNLM